MEIGFPVAFTDPQNDTIGGNRRISCHEMLQLCSILGKKVFFCMECGRVEIDRQEETRENQSLFESDKNEFEAEWSHGLESSLRVSPVTTVPPSTWNKMEGSNDSGIDTSSFGANAMPESIDQLLMNRVIPKASKSSKPKKSKTSKTKNNLKESQYQWNIEYEMEEKGMESFEHEETLLKQYLADNPQDAVLLQALPTQEGDWQEEYEVDPHKYTLKFQKTVARNPEQVIRYGKRPLWFQRPHEIPSCSTCSKDRMFEFQIMPYLISLFLEGKSLQELKNWVNKLDFVTILVFVCPTCHDSYAIVEKEE
jgi:predicted RNA-binding Zn-ribbon protein involved in translation (DUF1610 family)